MRGGAHLWGSRLFELLLVLYREVRATRLELRALRGEVRKILRLLEPGQAVRFIFTVQVEGESKEDDAMSLVMSNIQKAALSVRGLDAKGNPATLENVQFSTSDESLVEFQPGPDLNSAVVVAKGPAGSGEIRVTADADIDEGEAILTGTLPFEIQPSQAVALEVTAGTPSDQ